MHPSTSSGGGVESLDQLFTRVSSRSRPSLANLQPNIFGTKQAESFARQIIEITGETNVGKTHLIMELIARVILPVRYGGCDADAIFIDTDHHFQIFKLAAILEKQLLSGAPEESPKIESCPQLSEDETRTIIDASLKRCLLLKCHSPEQLQLAILGLDRLFRQNGNAAFLALDSVSTFYWLESNETKPIRMDTYAKHIIGKMAKVAKDHGVLVAYVRPFSFRSKSDGNGGLCVNKLTPYPVYYCLRLEEIVIKDNARINTGESDQTKKRNRFRCKVQDGKSGNLLREPTFIIDSFGIQWENLDTM